MSSCGQAAYVMCHLLHGQVGLHGNDRGRLYVVHLRRGGRYGGNLRLEARVEGLAKKSTQTTRYDGCIGDHPLQRLGSSGGELENGVGFIYIGRLDSRSAIMTLDD
eukprot:1721731-Pyramimonas_sp.AAC.1